MIFTTIKLHGLTHKRREILQTVSGLVDRMPCDSGCLGVDIYQDIENRDIFYLHEKWNSKKDLEEYKKSNSLAVLMGIRALLVESIEIKHSIKCNIKSFTQNEKDTVPKGENINEKDNSR